MAICNLLQWLLCPLAFPHPFLKAHPYLFCIAGTPGSFCILPVSVLELVISPMNPRFLLFTLFCFYWKKVFDLKIWILDVLGPAELSFVDIMLQ